MKHERGFSLVEMVVVLVIMAILLGLGLPSYRSYMANQRILSAAEVFLAGLQLARGEAVKLNQRVQMVLPGDGVDPTLANVDVATPASGAAPYSGRSWMVRGFANAVAADVPGRALAAGGNTFIEGKSGAEGSGTASAAASSIVVSGSVPDIAFDGFGQPSNFSSGTTFVALTTTATFDFSSASASCAPVATSNCTVLGVGTGTLRCLQLRVTRGGQARLCDPAVLTSDTRNCCL